MPRRSSKLLVRSAAVAAEIEYRILVIRGHKVMLDSDLARAYGVSVKQLNQAAKRNADRFPVDFMFQLTWDEDRFLRSQIVTLNAGRGRHRKYPPYAFTEHGAVMLATVLNSPVAVQASIQVVRAFVRLRQMVLTNDKLRRKLAQIEAKLQQHDEHFAAVFEAIRQLMDEDDEPAKPRPQIGYSTEARRGGSAKR